MNFIIIIIILSTGKVTEIRTSNCKVNLKVNLSYSSDSRET